MLRSKLSIAFISPIQPMEEIIHFSPVVERWITLRTSLRFPDELLSLLFVACLTLCSSFMRALEHGQLRRIDSTISTLFTFGFPPNSRRTVLGNLAGLVPPVSRRRRLPTQQHAMTLEKPHDAAEQSRFPYSVKHSTIIDMPRVFYTQQKKRCLPALSFGAEHPVLQFRLLFDSLDFPLEFLDYPLLEARDVRLRYSKEVGDLLLGLFHAVRQAEAQLHDLLLSPVEASESRR